MLIWTNQNQSLGMLGWYLRNNASFPLSSLFRKSYLECFHSFRSNKHIWKLQMIRLHWVKQLISSPPPLRTQTQPWSSHVRNLTSSHEKLILVIFSCRQWSIPHAGHRFHACTFCVWPLRHGKGEQERNLMESVHRLFVLGIFLPEGQGSLLLWDLELWGKPVQGLSKATTWLKVGELYEIEEGLFFLLLLGTKGNWRNWGIFLWKCTGYLYLYQDLTSHLHYFFLKLTFEETHMRNSS